MGGPKGPQPPLSGFSGSARANRAVFLCNSIILCSQLSFTLNYPR